MTELYNATCMQRHLIDLGTTVPASFRVFTPSSLSRTQSEFISASARFESPVQDSFLMEGRQMNDAFFSVRAQAPAALQSLFESASAFCVGGDLSTSLSALSLSLCAAAELGATSTASLLSRAMAKQGTAAVEALLSTFPAACRMTLSVVNQDSSGARLISLPMDAENVSRFIGGHIRVSGSLFDAGWSFLSSSVAITVTADWMRTRSFFSFSRTASAKSERFRAVSAFRSVHPTMERALRL